MTVRPRILITTSTAPRLEGMRRDNVVSGLNYAEGIVRAGGLPLMVPNVAADLADAFLDTADGLLLAGGGDVDPALYDRPPHPRLGLVDRTRDAIEFALYRGARARGLPIFGICRGLQLINVAEGGSLHQHLPTLDGAQQHAQTDNSGAPQHPVTLAPDSRLATAFGAERVRSNSYHHQAIDRLGRGLRATAWSDDGHIEAIEGAGGPFLLAVQWHPEMSFARFPEQFAPFALFQEALHEEPVGSVGGRS
jgi:putative glutamine amidotransferase